jgi:multicomponent Na+:H+ antiporter subunit C
VSGATIFGLGAALLVCIGLYGLIVEAHPLRKILAFNVIGSGVFLLLGAIARRGAAAGMGGDPVPQALLITGIVVAFRALALAWCFCGCRTDGAATAPMRRPGTAPDGIW